MRTFFKVKQMTKKGMACLLSAILTVSAVPDTIGYADSEGGSTLPVIGDVTEVTTVENGEKTTKDWKLVWSDEFEGTSLDTTKWDYMVGTGAEYSEDGWGNSECEYYTAGENLSFEDGHLVITAKQTGDEKEKYGNKAYTSTRLWTRGDGEEALFAKKYGRFEAAISMPEGTGYWPAFWMMPAYDEYGVWAASGEIDIMEARGRVTNSIGGTVHYGGTWPNDKLNGGTYTDDDLDITQEHVYAIEWEPGEMRWYIDNELYYSSSTWYSIGDGNAENYTYGAPFDQEFYILLNMAVGGNYDSGQLDETIDGGQMKVDYVRVYDEVGEDGQVVDYDENVQPKTADVGELLGGEVGENLTSSSLETISKVTTDYATEGTNGWDLLALEGFGGAADVSYEDGAAKVTISNGGDQSYSVQLTHKLPLTYGYRYQISFMAKSDQARTISIKAGQASGSFAAYTDTFTPSLTTEYKNYVYTFDMVSDSDEDCRIEFNMGQNTSSVYIKDIQLISTGTTPVAGENEAKEPLTNGEHIYNGTFDQGNNVDDSGIMTRLKYWNSNQLSASVDSDTREVCLSDSIEGTFSQEGVNLLHNDEYLLQFDARADKESKLTTLFENLDRSTYSSNITALTTEMNHYSYTFIMEGETNPLSKLVFVPEGKGEKVYIDNVSLTRLTDNNVDYSNTKCYLIGNGSFEAGTSSFSTYQTNMGIDTMPEYSQLWVAAAPCQNNYDMMLLNTDLNFTAGMKYTMKFKAKTSSSDAQDVIIRIQREGGDWASVLDESFKVTDEWQDYEYQFTSTLGDTLNLKYLLGEVTSGCNIYFRDIELYVTSKPVKEAAYLYSGNSTKAGQEVVVNYLDKDSWEENSAITYYINGEKADASYVVIDKEANTLTFDKSLFEEAGIYQIQAKVDGFDMTNIVSQTVLDASGNVVVNGDFSDGTNGWGSYFTNGCGSFAVNDGEADVNFVWHEGQTWDLQLYQDGMELQGGVPYMVQFKAKSTIDRDITVEFPTAVAFQTVSLTKDYQTFTYFYTPSEDISAKINLLLGNINGVSNENNSHTISFDDIVIRKATDEDIYGESPVITCNTVFYEDQDVTLSYTENPLWEQKDKEIFINEVKVNSDEATFDTQNNTVTIAASYFSVGKNEVKIVAKDYEDKDPVEAVVVGLDGEYIENGGFDNDGEGFGTWFAEGDMTGSITFDGKAVATLIKPYYAWEMYVNYAIQLYQENITVTPGKEYTLSFMAASTLEKNIAVEITGVETTTEALTADMTKYTITFIPTVSKIKVNFLLSESPQGEETPAHNITLDDISLKESGYVVPSYHISYVLGEGNNAKDNPVSYQYGSTVTLLDAEREGYTFDGWYLEEGYVNKVTVIESGKKGDITLYAKFTKIIPPVIEVKKITLNKTSGTLLKGDAIQLKAVVTPSNATDKTVTFTTSNNKVATVTSKGLVTAVGEGTASITAKAGNVKAVYKVQVVVKPSKVTGVKVSKEKITSFRVAYSKKSGSTGYQVAVYRSNKRILVKSTKNTAITISGLTSGTTYKVKVRAYKTAGGKNYYGELSDAVTFTTAPARTKITSIKKYKSTGVKLQYKKISQATGYEIYMKKKGGTYKKISVQKGSSKVSYTTTSLKKGTTYYFRVRAYRKVGSKTVYGSFSNTVKYYCKK